MENNINSVNTDSQSFDAIQFVSEFFDLYYTRIIWGEDLPSDRTKHKLDGDNLDVLVSDFRDLTEFKKFSSDVVTKRIDFIKNFENKLCKPENKEAYRKKFFDELKKVIETNFGRKSIFLQSTVLDPKEIEKLESDGFDKHIIWFSEAVKKLTEEPKTLIEKIQNGEIDLSVIFLI